jgi:hypothetical protein
MMAQAAVRQLLLAVAAGSLMAGCVAGTGGDTGGGTAALADGTAAPAARRGSGAEVEAPEVFQVTDSALWDGRPSLGGIWVASPDTVDPERVVMFNPATGKSVKGALFRRERDNPGPTLQISSDAAEALGILAGQPTQIRVTALRRSEPEAPVDPAAAPVAATEVAAAEGTPPEAGAAGTEADALAAAALAATGAATEEAGEAAGEAATEAAAVAEPAEPARKTWKERRAEAKARREAERAARAAAKAEAEAQAAAAEAGETGIVTPVDPAASAVAEVETAPLDARAPEPAAAPLPEAAPAPAAAETPAPAASGASRPIQIASFSKEENANRAVEALAKIGITAQPQKSDRNGTAVWGVVAMGDAALLARIKDAGFADAYFLQ